MKLVKFVPALAATLVLAACSTATDTAKEANAAAAEAMKSTTSTMDTAAGAVTQTKETLMTQHKSVAYKCSKGDVVVNYAFHNDVAKGANVRIGKKLEVNGFLANDELSQKVGSPVFVSGNYVLTTDNGLSYANAEKTALVMITEKGAETDTILAKNCSIKKGVTARLNK